MRIDEFDYELPEDLIAQTPALERDKSRLLVVDRRTGSLSHRMFYEVIEYLNSGDILVVNDTKVIPARLMARRSTGGKVEVLLLRQVEPDIWECLVRPGHKVKVGEKVSVGVGEKGMTGTVLSRTDYGGRMIRWEYKGDWEENLQRLGHTPLPPYIKMPLSDPSRYQTVYARIPGSAAAPTAGLHFTEELLERIRQKGVVVKSITLEVGLGTFRPVREEIVEHHKMHREHFTVNEETAAAINDARERGGKLVAVGTTVVRALETSALEDGTVRAFSGSTELFIYPGYRFKAVDHLITNFHLPKSTLLMLVSAFAGKELIMKAYHEAIRERYRFYSFGDAMLIL
ncbi:MAG: tRNA preQ1(34) S-adenosylmethionine ribosyltransferase-isomerase QueA [Candidatus Fermentithermobacillus carboniphilus]|uniref:S-adenosylmethionine:tRNA ribosyltransferase-isomerase n=1 Tax=Candidatus Fermentithermobacillus carboniphilus TaxID=3085328 RepID=A0AAT9LD93_9FIRM|nr:MAG: tRNA preQ1(34) S-adenosylmethionine ribosyltransferase-isomerase QueA [Candidatus Fermentithermobacillus carboniphilus]